MKLELKARKPYVAAGYAIAAIVVGMLLYYWYSIAMAPQPQLTVTYNSIEGFASGFMVNTLGYPILVTSFYCTLPDSKRLVFSYSNQSNRYLNDNGSTNSVFEAGANVPVVLTPSQNGSVPTNCTGWRTNYHVVSDNTVK